MKIEDIIKILQIDDIEFVGSFADTKQKYYNDIDLHDDVKKKISPEEIYKLFLNMFNIIYNNLYTYILDFKCGSLPNYSSIKWTYNDIKKGYVTINDVEYPFTYLVKTISSIQIDIVAFIDDRFINISCNYFFTFDNIHTRIVEDPSTDFLNAFLKYKQKNNYYKAYKRLYNYFVVKKDRTNSRKILKLLNSNIGSLDQQIYNLTIIDKLINNTFRIPYRKNVLSSLIYIYNHIDDQYKYLIKSIITHLDNKKIYNITYKNLSKKINVVLKRLVYIINDLVISYVRKNDLYIFDQIYQ